MTGTMGTPPAEAPIDADLVRALLEAQHPDLAALPLTLVGEGWDNVMFRLGEDLALRLPRRTIAAELIRNEQRWLPGLAPRLPLAVPVPLRIGEPDERFPWSWSVIPWLAGRTADLDRPGADQAGPLAGFLRALHQPAPDEAPRNPVRGVPLQPRIEAVGARLERLAGRTEVVTSRIRDVWSDALDAPAARTRTWLHGDLHARNVLAQDGRLTGVIDWGDITAGDAATDLASLWMLLPHAAARARAMDAYGQDDPDLWRRARGWAVLFAAFLLDTGLEDHPQHAAMGQAVFGHLNEGDALP
jgi:aminoglycoside phosphotransferase (APT) family kinase protein